MRNFILGFVLGILLCLQSASAQNSDLQKMEDNLRGAYGVDRVQKLIELSEYHSSAGDFKQSEHFAEEAEDFARRIKAPELRATALNRWGKAQMSRAKKGLLGRPKPAQKFRSSIDLLREIKSTNKALILDNLEQLRQLAIQVDKPKEVAEIDFQIQQVKSGNLSGMDSDSKQELKQEVVTLQQALAAQQASKAMHAEAQDKLIRESTELQKQLKSQEAAINVMSADQMKATLILMQQQQLVDSLSFKTNLDSLQISNANLALKQAEQSKRLNYGVILVLMLIGAGAFYSLLKARQHAKILEAKNQTIREEQERSENLLLNILPALVAEELKKQGSTDARYFENATVLFADFVGFSKISEILTPQQLVFELDTCFRAFDQIIAKFGLEKIKTIGDAYMCAGGIDGSLENHAKNMVFAAKEMQDWLSHWNANRSQENKPLFEARIGIHCGPVVAGVVGSKKFAFDIWGDTVNIAARIEQAGVGGKINISGKVYESIQNMFDFEYRGKIAAKNKGEIDMYFIEN